MVERNNGAVIEYRFTFGELLHVLHGEYICEVYTNMHDFEDAGTKSARNPEFVFGGYGYTGCGKLRAKYTGTPVDGLKLMSKHKIAVYLRESETEEFDGK